MFPLSNVPAIEPSEMMARFLLKSNEFRSDGTVHANAFFPYKEVELSVTRRRDLERHELWKFGRDVATFRALTLYGRADIAVADCSEQNLELKADPLDGSQNGLINSHHAIIDGYSSDRHEQRNVAQKLAAKASRVFRVDT